MPVKETVKKMYMKKNEKLKYILRKRILFYNVKVKYMYFVSMYGYE